MFACVVLGAVCQSFPEGWIQSYKTYGGLIVAV